MNSLNQRQRDALDRHITGDYGERQFENEDGDDEEWQNTGNVRYATNKRQANSKQAIHTFSRTRKSQ